MTPLQELINWVHRDLKLYGYEHKVIIEKILELKEREREIVIDSFNEGKLNEIGVSEFINGNDFYNNL